MVDGDVFLHYNISYYYDTGRRKSSVARVHLFPKGTGAISINGRDIEEYFGLETLKIVVRHPLDTAGDLGRVDITVTGRADILRHGIARALLEMAPEFHPVLKATRFLSHEEAQEVWPQGRLSHAAVLQVLTPPVLRNRSGFEVSPYGAVWCVPSGLFTYELDRGR